MGKGDGKARRSNIIFLIEKIYKTQSELARIINHGTLTQPILSRIERGKRRLKNEEARDVEQILGVPAGWMDRENWVRIAWPLIMEYRKLDKEERAIASRLSTFVFERLNAEASTTSENI